MKKQVLSLLLVMLMVVSLVPTGMIQANAESFQPRLSMTPENAPSYYTTLNPYYTSGYGMPNCTCYAYGRAYEILGKNRILAWGTHKSGGTIIREIIITRLAKHRLLVR